MPLFPHLRQSERPGDVALAMLDSTALHLNRCPRRVDIDQILVFGSASSIELIVAILILTLPVLRHVRILV